MQSRNEFVNGSKKVTTEYKIVRTEDERLNYVIKKIDKHSGKALIMVFVTKDKKVQFAKDIKER
jgi:hypothetical protein